MRNRLFAGLGFALTVLASTPLQASSPGAWEEFRVDVEKGCKAAVGNRLIKPTYTVDPFGTETYGVAIARGRTKYDKARHAIVCIFDKKSKKTEATQELPQ